MKHIITKPTLLLFSSILILILSGCGTWINDGRQLIIDDAVVPDQATINFYNMYKLTDVNNQTSIWITFSPIPSSSSYKVFLYPLTKTKKESYSYQGNRSVLQYPQYLDGYSSVSVPDSYSAYFIAESDRSYDYLLDFSNIVKVDDIIQFDVGENDQLSETDFSVFSDYGYRAIYSTSYNTGNLPLDTKETWSSTYKYLWVELDNTVWVCLGNPGH